MTIIMNCGNKYIFTSYSQDKKSNLVRTLFITHPQRLDQRQIACAKVYNIA
jgi:hypothetical protein